ncbi:hypothetical protein B0I00_1555 [Novosphingobium kunmingense]|uniref:Lysylphosphatidylglycerol synthase-like protein n=1 Tax=Novosphingobium kunmingense TaxID=1211806 RepID=A0A2N0HK56_9SPHN|nr:hypothetical protein [Novosphingobium kunmingense]PKB19324.1 hypothetical protein B0I00_1555 [Novosphingobium kunmingense]
MEQTRAATDREDDLPVSIIPSDKPRSQLYARIFSALISGAMIVAVLREVWQLDFSQVAELFPSSALFWTLFVLTYLSGPFGDWLIYRYVWTLPITAFGACVRKVISNELLLGYLGEVQFYSWARARLSMVAAPFGAIKDATILSALTGNAVTAVMLVFAWPLVSSGQLGVGLRDAYLSLGVVLVTSIAIVLFRRRLFSLPKHQLYIITLIHVGRIIITLTMSALLWHLVLPAVPVTLWLVLATLRMLISRLPLLPNKDVVFAGITVFLLGHENEVASLITLMTGLQLASHLVAGTVFGLLDVVNARKMK